MRITTQLGFNGDDSLVELLNGHCELFERQGNLVGGTVRDDRSLSDCGHDQSVALQQAERLLSGVRRDVVLLGQTTHRRDRVAWTELTGGDFAADVIGDQLVRGAGVGRSHVAQVTSRITRVSRHLTRSLEWVHCSNTPDTHYEEAEMERTEPTRRELRAIDVEWPVIAAELAVVEAEVAALQTGVESSELDRRRLRREQSRLARRIVADAAVDGLFGGAA